MTTEWTSEDERELKRAIILRNALTEDIATFGPAGDDLGRLQAVRARMDELQSRKPKPPVSWDDDMPGDR